MVKCRALSFLSVLLVILLVCTIYSLPRGTTPDITLRNTDVHSLAWSGEYEGEVVEVKYTGPGIGPMTPPFNRFSLARGIEEFKRIFGRPPLLPTLLPENIKYVDVYIGGSVVIISFNDKEAESFEESKISIEISYNPKPPSPDDLRKCLKEPDEKLLQIGDMWVWLKEKAWGQIPFALFFKDDLYYTIAAWPPITAQDLIKIIESMKPPH